MKFRTFNLVASMSAFILGASYVLSDGASINANVIGASGGSAGLTAFIGMIMIIGSIGLFIVVMHGTDHRSIDLERLIRHNKFTDDEVSRKDEETREAYKKE